MVEYSERKRKLKKILMHPNAWFIAGLFAGAFTVTSIEAKPSPASKPTMEASQKVEKRPYMREYKL